MSDITDITINEIDVSDRLYQEGDLARVLEIISEHDEDDAEEAEKSLNSSHDINWVAVRNGIVVGISGYERVLGTDKTAYLSWTYVQKAYCGKGIGSQLLDAVLDHARGEGCRLMLVKLSDYIESGASISIYNAAKQLYLKKGFTTQIFCNDFYDEGEGIEILSVRLQNSADTPKIKDEKPRLAFFGLREISETHGAYTFDWNSPPGFSFSSKRNFSKDDIQLGLDAAENACARAVFLTFPSNLPLIHRPLQQAGFKYLGEIKDYYEDGLDEMHFIFQFK